eukprot:GEMP01024291.1.p1 GENE.GEMP01024291.1~~GEMP01024291.1.p1  ORF type:complete len:449 (+),score=78.78 GEMP01024291.1:49-1395(+)
MVCDTSTSRSITALGQSASSVSGEGSLFAVVLGAQWGDEGKGKLVDILAQKVDLCARFNGGANAGHTLVVEGRKYAFHLLPCGMISKSCTNLIGNGVVLHIPTLLNELESLKSFDPDALKRLFISSRAHLLFDAHRIVDGMLEAEKDTKAIGTTKRGIGPCYSTKTIRNGLRVGDLLHFDTFTEKLRALLTWLHKCYGVESDIEKEIEAYRGYAELLKDQIADSVYMMHKAIKENKRILAEGANAALLDIDFGTYPYVTSSNTTSGAISTGLGVPPKVIDCIIGVVKAYTTRVGAGPFPTELNDEMGDHLRSVGHEFGTTTGRPRRCGWLDIPMIHFSHCLNGYSSVNITKLDVLTGLKTLKICVAYKDGNSRLLPVGYFPDHLDDLKEVRVVYEELPGWEEDISKARSMDDLPVNAQKYLRRVEEHLKVPISWVGVGPDREDMFCLH